jgi:hypothetical protein
MADLRISECCSAPEQTPMTAAEYDQLATKLSVDFGISAESVGKGLRGLGITRGEESREVRNERNELRGTPDNGARS